MPWVFWGSLAVLAYIYAGYPLLAWAAARLFGRAPAAAETTPVVSLLIPAYNEERYLAQKLANVMALDYPRDRLEIVVASDGSTDRTNGIARQFADRGVALIALPENVGKTAMLNRVVPQLRGAVVVFSDVSGTLEHDAVRRLVRSFADARVGCVSGLYRLAGAGDLRSEGEGLYWRYETFIKQQESRLHSILGGHGAFYAIRASLFRPLTAGTINDDYLIPMQIVAQGYRAVYEPTAVAWEQELVSMEGEFARRRRIAMGNCQQVVALRGLLNPLRGWIAWCFFSHKLLRTLAPIFMLALLASTAWAPAPWRAPALLLQAAFYGSAAVGYWLQRRGRSSRWLSAPLYFCFGNLAMLAGLATFCCRRRPLVWERAR